MCLISIKTSVLDLFFTVASYHSLHSINNVVKPKECAYKELSLEVI